MKGQIKQQFLVDHNDDLSRLRPVKKVGRGGGYWRVAYAKWTHVFQIMTQDQLMSLLHGATQLQQMRWQQQPIVCPSCLVYIYEVIVMWRAARTFSKLVYSYPTQFCWVKESSVLGRMKMFDQMKIMYTPLDNYL